MTNHELVVILRRIADRCDSASHYDDHYVTPDEILALRQAANELVMQPDEPRARCSCGMQAWDEGYVEVRDSRDGLHYADRPCWPSPLKST